MKDTYPALPVSQAQKNLPRLCRSGKSWLITNRDAPSSVLLPIADYEALLETMDLLSSPAALAQLRKARAGKLKYKPLNLADEDLGL